MVWIKRLNNSDTGDSTHLGGDHWDTNDKYFDNTDVEATTGKPAKIMTKTWFHDGKLIISNGTNTYTIKTGTLSGGNVDLTLPSLSANGTLLSSAGANTWTGLQTFGHQLFKQLNPAGTFGYIHNTSAIGANRNVTWPLLTADDEVVMKNFGQTLTTKTLNIDSNTLKHSTTNGQGDLYTYDTTAGKIIRRAKGTANQVATMKSDASDWEWATPAASGSGSGGLVTPELGNITTGAFYATAATAGAGVWSDFLTNISTVTPSYPAGTSVQLLGRMSLAYTVAAIDGKAGFRTTATHFCRQNDPELWVRYIMDSSASSDIDYRLIIGFVSDLAADYTVNNPLTSQSAFCWFKELADTNIQVGRNDGDGTQDKDSAVSLAATNNLIINTIKVFADNTNSRFGISLNGAAATYYTTEIPSSTTPLGCIVQFTNEDTVSRTFHILGAYFKATIK